MPAIRVAKAPRCVVIFGKEERGVGAIGRIFVKELVHRFQEALRLVQSYRALTTKIRLKIGHQKSRGDSLPCNVADYQPEPLLTQVQEIVVIAANLARLNANTRVLECAQKWLRLGKEPGLDLGCNFQFLRSAAFGFQFPGDDAALRFDLPAGLIEAHKRE
jgi:hypothetical protein